MELTRRQRAHWTVYLAPFVLTAILGVAMTFSVVQSIVRSNWTNFGLPVMTTIALGGLAVGAIFGRLRWLPASLAHLLATVLGVAWVVNRVGPLLGAGLPTWRDQATEIVIRSIILGRVVSSGGTGDDLLLFITVLGALGYGLGYATLWLLLRRGWAWWVVLLNATVLLINLTYASPKPPAGYFFVFVGAALLILVHQSFQSRATSWDAALLEYPDLLGWRVVGSGATVVVLLVLFTTLLPTRITSAQVAHVWQRVRDPWQNVQQRWDRTFSTINAPANAVVGGFANRSLTLSGARNLGTALVMEVESESFEYWRATAYDRYDGSLSWLNTTGDLARATLGLSTADRARTPLSAAAEMPLLDTLGRKVLTQTFTLSQNISVSTLFAATQPISLTVPALVEHTYLPGGSGAPVPNFGDTSAFVAQQPLRSGASYSVTSLVSDVDKTSLRNAPTTYDTWVERYLQLPQSLPQRVRDEAQRIVAAAGAQNPYDVAEAIQASLRTLPYDEKIPFPPEQRDGVDYFLFDLRRGYCDYFAAAMVVLLRSEGVPARLVSGYAGGVLNEETGRYEVRQNVAHTWPEVYFPGYGWHRFEPTPASYTAVPERAETPEQQAAGEQGEDLAGAGALDGADLGEQYLDEIERAYRDRANADFNIGAVQEAIRLREAAERRRAVFRGVAVAAGLGGLLLIVLAFIRRAQQFGPAAHVYDRVLRLATWAGVSTEASRTPHEIAARIAERLPDRRAPLHTVASAYTRERYAPDPTADPSEVEPAWRALRWPLAGAFLGRFFSPAARAQIKQKRR